MKKYLILFVLSMIAWHTKAQDTGQMRYLYGTKEIPKSKVKVDKLEELDKPKLYVHKAKLEKKDLVFLVIPGGGYAGVAINHEGHDVAKRLNDLGYSAYVLFYRLPKADLMEDKRFGPLQDAQYAIAQIREENPGKQVAVIGFSAGGHLAGTLSNFFEKPQTEELANANLRPDYSILCYPVLSMDDAITHGGSKQNLIGPDVKPEDVELFSLEKQVDETNQPTFLMSAKDDKAVPIANSYNYQKALNTYNIPNTLFTYEEGGHGFGLINKTDSRDWFATMIDWLKTVKK
ncbi:alpha/beta hydrolase [Sphingobacterium endophyticum]|uniref:alpha/beta hydrolase n=1 Tax=Sphingobacterium endophyticum TaxID=2546448 RepID=UPI0012E1E533|nr:alpha/beta hydrolase [Sphingobacterium endophyticum]